MYRFRGKRPYTVNAGWKNTFFFIVLFFMACLPGFLTAQTILPGDGFAPGWMKEGKVRLFQKEDLFNYIDGGAELFHEFGFMSLYVQEYCKGEEELVLELYRMTEPAAALGVYLLKKGHEKSVPGVACRHSGNAFQILAVKGDYFITVRNYSGNDETAASMARLVNRTADTIQSGTPVDLSGLLPKQDLIPESMALFRGPYALEPVFTFGEGDVLLLNGKVFGVLADYQVGDAVITRLIIPYGTEEAARAAFDNLCNNLDSYLEKMRQTSQELVFKDYQGKYGRARFEQNRLTIEIHLPVLPNG